MRIWLVSLLLAASVVGSAAAESLNSTFAVRLYGAPVGRMVIAANVDGSTYAATGEFRTTGLIGLLARVRFTMHARGVGALPDLSTRSYSEDLDTGYRQSAISFSFAASDPRVDPLTALIATIADRPISIGCAYDGRTFDGERSMRISIRKASDEADRTVCAGQLTRLQGYTDAELAEARGFAFSVEFRHADDLLVVEQAAVRTIHGHVSLVRR
jgi:hypothetical protein